MNQYQSLIEKAITTVTADFTEMKIYKDEKWRYIPPNTVVLIPLGYAGIVTMPNILFWFLGHDKKAELTITQPIPEEHKRKEHYLFQLHHGFDYSHHGESLESSMLIEKESLDRLATLEPDEVKYSETVMYKAFNRLIEHVFPKVIKLDESSIAWHDEELLTKVESAK